jgi:hypothetical protein
MFEGIDDDSDDESLNSMEGEGDVDIGGSGIEGEAREGVVVGSPEVLEGEGAVEELRKRGAGLGS